MNNIMSRIKNSLETSPTLSTLWEMYFDMKEGRIITIPPFLQRYLQESAWVKKEHKKAKEYLHSAFTATSLFEPFILVSIDLLIKNLSSDIKQWNEDGSSEMVLQAKKALDDLKKKKSKGAKWAMIDGQSRNMLALKPFFESDIAIDKSMIIEHFDKETKKLQSTEDVNGVFFEDMSLETKQLLKTIEAFVVRIEGGNIDNIVSALIAKQQGIPFTAFQKIYHGKYISVFANRLEKYITIAITDGYKKYIAQKDKFKAEESGLEYFFATLSIFFKYRNWPSNSKIENVMHGVEDVPTTTTLSKIKKYTNEYLDYFGSIDEKDVQKYSSKVLQNYILFRWYLDNWNKKESFFSQYNLPEIKIIAQNSFVKAFIELLFRTKMKDIEDTKEFKFYLLTGIGRFIGGTVEVEEAQNKDMPQTIEALTKIFNSNIKMITTPGKKNAWEKDAGAAKVFFSIMSDANQIIDLQIRYKGSYTANPQFQAVATADFKAIFK